MPLDQGQGSPPDRTEADHHDRAGDAAMYGPMMFGHDYVPVSG
jgi:hypothetical protein